MKKTDWNQLLKDQPQLLIEVVNCLLDSAIHVQNDASSTNSLANDFVSNNVYYDWSIEKGASYTLKSF